MFLVIDNKVFRFLRDLKYYCLGEDEFKLIVHGTGAVSIIITVVCNTLFLFFDVFLKPESLRKYKVQLHTNEPLDWRKLFKVNEEF